MAELNTGLDAGDETRHHGDYVGFPHPVPDETNIDDISSNGPVEGELVTHDGTDIASVTFDSSGNVVEDILGVLYTYQYYGDSQYGPFVRGDRDATVKLDGTVVVDFSAFADDANASVPTAGDIVGPNGEIVVLTDASSNADNLGAVRIRG